MTTKLFVLCFSGYLCHIKKSTVLQISGLEREYKRIERNPPDRPDALGQLLGLIVKQKPPFRRGDDVWTRMEETTRLFVEEMTGRS